jgi:hypothetical protein
VGGDDGPMIDVGRGEPGLTPAVFADVLGLPTIWIPHSYAGCSQHAPNEPVLAPICEEALQIMTGLWWDLGSGDTP